MRLLTFAAEGVTRVGALVGENIVEFPPELGDLKSLLGSRTGAELAELLVGRPANWPLSAVEVLVPIANPGKVICVGVNYRSHRDETGHKENEYPTLFTRFADTQMPHEAVAIRPTVTSRFDYEGELAVIIGRPAHHVGAEQAWDHVAGVSVYNDFTVRDWQKHSSQWTPGKNFPATGGFGPTLVTLDEIEDFDALRLTTRVNGEVRQNAPLADLIFGVPALISYISTFTALSPGDVIVTGTPGGVGQFMDPPVFLDDGDVVEVEVSGIGTLRNLVRAEQPR
jgi:2-keto-4-pentenoate hydratase/2-oxohepta-3-ene-1,7-dioic acid hydratase in catechol pathway